MIASADLPERRSGLIPDHLHFRQGRRLRGAGEGDRGACHPAPTEQADGQEQAGEQDQSGCRVAQSSATAGVLAASNIATGNFRRAH